MEKNAEETRDLTFEEAMQQIEELLRSMENSSLSLNDTLAAFERGVGLTRFCQEYLDKAEQRIEFVIAASSGDLEIKPLILEKENVNDRPL